ncbi:MAG: hypothetical protein R2744_03485 [Bacteroidales bacterium]
MVTDGNAQILDAAFTELYNQYEFNKLFEVPDQNDGSPYLLPEFTPGNIIMKDGMVYHDIASPECLQRYFRVPA